MNEANESATDTATESRHGPQPGDLARAALRYAGLGYRVFPLRPGEKTPLTEHGLLDASNDEEQVAAWWAETPDANIGLRTDDLLGLDLDGADNPWLFSGSEEALARAESLIGYPRQRTPRGGYHVVTKQPPPGSAKMPTPWRNTFGAIAPKVDTRANGGYIVVAPSVSSTGRPYQWLEGCALDVPPDQLPEPPDWLCEILNGLNAPRPTSVTAEERRHIPEGRRNGTLTSIAGQMRRFGLGAEEMLAALLACNKNRCVPPLGQEEVVAIAQSIARYEPDQVATIMAEGGIFDEEEEPDEIPHPGVFPEELLKVPGLVNDVMAWTLETSHRRQPILALGSALALMSVLTGNKVQDEAGTQTNIYVIGLAKSGSGKDRGRNVNKSVTTEAGCEELLGPEDISSSAGMVSSLEESPSRLFQVDEFGRFLQTLKNPNKAPHLYAIVTTLMKIYTSSGSTYNGAAYADLKKVKKVHWPHAVLYGTSVPESFYESMTREGLANGFVARLLVFDAGKELPVFQSPRMTRVPEWIVKAARAWAQFDPAPERLNRKIPEPRTLTTSPEAMQIFTDLNAIAEREFALNEMGCGPTWMRLVEKARKLAILYGASEQGPALEVIDERAASWAARLAEYLIRKLLYSAQENIADNTFESDCKHVKKAIDEKGSVGMGKRPLLRKFRRFRVKELDEILERLLIGGEIVKDLRETGGRIATMFVTKRHVKIGGPSDE